MTDSQSVLIVGGGIVGIACAHYLNKAGFQVTVIDRGPIAAACSHGNCGYVCPSHVLPLTEPAAIKTALRSLGRPDAPFRVKPSIALRHLPWFLQFARRCNEAQMVRAGQQLKSILDASMQEYRQLMRQETLPCDWQETGLLYVFRTAAGLTEFSEVDHFLTQHFEVTARQLDGRELVDFEPALKSGLAGAYYYPGDASLRPDLLNRAWTELLRERGVQFQEHCQLLHVERDASKVLSVQTTQGSFVTDQFVFAMGAWSPEIAKQLGCRLPIQPGKGYSVTMARPERCPKYPLLFPEHRIGVSPFGTGYRLGSMMEFCGYDTSIAPRRIAQLRASAEPYLWTPHTDDEQERWYGWRPMTWDSLPIIGLVPSTANAYVAAGHNMLGLSLATGTGKLIAEMLRGQPTHISAEAFRVDRF